MSARSGERLDLGIRALGAGGVVEVVEDEQLGAWRDGRFDGVEVEQEVVLVGDEAVRHGDAAEELDLALVDGESGVGVQDLVARVHQREQELLDHRLATRLYGDVLRRVGDAARGRDILCERLSQLGDARVGAVAGLAVPDRPERGLGDVPGRRQVHVAEVERIDSVAERLPLGRLGGDGECRLGPEVADALGQDARARCAERCLSVGLSAVAVHAAHPLNVKGQGDVPITLSAADTVRHSRGPSCRVPLA